MRKIREATEAKRIKINWGDQDKNAMTDRMHQVFVDRDGEVALEKAKENGSISFLMSRSTSEVVSHTSCSCSISYRRSS